MSRLTPTSLIIALVVVFAVAAITVGSTLAAGTGPSDLLSTPVSPAESAGPDSKPTTPEELAAEEARYEADLERRGGRMPASGPETAGATIELENTVFKLPADAYIQMYTISVICIEGSVCPETPLYMIRRGDSTVEIDYSGKILFEDLVSGEESSFDWLREALK